MASTFLKTTLRSLYREKMYAVINIAGLSLAIACCLILGLYLRSELTYDQHNTKHRQIFRVVNEHNVNGNILSTARTSPSLGPMLAEDYPEIQGSVRLTNLGLSGILQNVLIRYGNDAFYWNNVFFADDNIFEVFTHNIIYGDPTTALVEPKSVAVSESFSKKYFGNANPIGETISVEEDISKITLVFADLPENSHLKYDVLFSHNSLYDPDTATQRRQRLWGGGDYT